MTVTTPAASHDLTDLLSVLADLELNNTTAAQKFNLRKQIRQCSKAVENYCNRVFAIQTYTEQFVPDGKSWSPGTDASILQLSRWPITAVTSVTEDGTVLTNGTDYVSNSQPGQLMRRNADTGLWRSWIAGLITVVYQAGYAVIPEDLQDAVHRMIRARRFAQSRDPMLRQETIPGVAEYQYWIASSGESGNFTPDVDEIISNYRMPALA